MLRASEKDVLAASVSAAITLYRAARALDEDLSLAIVGHADPSGTESGNWELSRQRAEVVRSAFLARGVPDSFCVAEGAGPVFSDPASTNRIRAACRLWSGPSPSLSDSKVALGEKNENDFPIPSEKWGRKFHLSCYRSGRHPHVSNHTVGTGQTPWLKSHGTVDFSSQVRARPVAPMGF